MNLINYPFDVQTCNIYLALFGYYNYQVLLQWKTPDVFTRPPDSDNGLPLNINPAIKLANFEIVNHSYGISEISHSWIGLNIDI